MSQRHQKLPGCIVSLSTDAITIITLLGLVYSMTSVKNVHAVQRKQSTKHCHDLTRSRRVRNIHCHAEERRWACPAKRSKDEVFRKCPLSGCGFFFFFLQGISLHHPAMPEDVQKQSLPQQLCKITGLVFSCVELGPWVSRFPLKNNRGHLTCNGVR